MSLLSSLLQFSDFNVSSLQLCKTPESASNLNLSLELTQRIPIVSPPIVTETRPTSKSLSKLNLFSSNMKIDPRERIIHRLMYKLEMKVRKHYYGFFVKLQDMKKNKISLNQKDNSVKFNPKIENGIAKLTQTHTLIFSKYFGLDSKKEALHMIKKFGNNRVGLLKISDSCKRFQKTVSFSAIKQHIQQLSKNQIRIQILCGSINQLNLQTNISKILKQTFEILKNFNPKLQQDFGKTPKKTGNYQQFKQNQANISKEYLQMLEKQRKRDVSPGHVKKSIKLRSNPNKLSVLKHQSNFLSSVVHSKIVQEALFGCYSQDKPNHLSKKCECDYIKNIQVQDLCDKSDLFFDKFSNQNPKANQQSFTLSRTPDQITPVSFIKQSRVQRIEDCDFYSNNTSRVSYNQYDDRSSNRDMTVSSVRSTFGNQAVSFKNSLVQERQSVMHSHVVSFVCQREDQNNIQSSQNLQNSSGNLSFLKKRKKFLQIQVPVAQLKTHIKNQHTKHKVMASQGSPQRMCLNRTHTEYYVAPQSDKNQKDLSLNPSRRPSITPMQR